MELPSALLSSTPPPKIKKSTPKKFPKFQKMELSSSKIKKFLIFREMELCSPKIEKVLIFLKKSFSYISGNGTFLKKFSEPEK